VQSLLVLAALNWLFELNYSLETFAALYLLMWLLAVISILLGIFISNFALNEGQVFPFIPLLTLPTVFFSGIILPAERLPEWASGLSILTPLYFANRVIQNLIQPGGALADDWGSLLALPLYGLIVLLLATLTLRERE
jgi:ABC-2 type transport system permease protein